MSQRLKKPFQSKGDQELHQVVHQTPFDEEADQTEVTLLPDPDGKEEEGRGKGRDRGDRAHYLE